MRTFGKERVDEKSRHSAAIRWKKLPSHCFSVPDIADGDPSEKKQSLPAFTFFIKQKPTLLSWTREVKSGHCSGAYATILVLRG